MRKNILFLGANGFPSKSYTPMLDILGKKGGFNVNTCDVFNYAYGSDWSNSISHIHSTIENSAKGKPIIGIGHSMGGAMMYLAAAQKPEYFEKLIIIDPPMYSLVSRQVLNCGRKIDFIFKNHPLIKATYRKKAKFETMEEAVKYVSSRRLYQTFDKKCLKSFIENAIIPIPTTETIEDHNDNNKYKYKFAFSPSAERFFYMQTPYDIDEPLLGQYKSIDIPGYFLYSEKHELIQSWDVKWLDKNFKSLKFVGSPYGHFFPLEYPEKTAEEILSYLVN